MEDLHHLDSLFTNLPRGNYLGARAMCLQIVQTMGRDILFR